MKILFIHLGREQIGIEYLSAVLKKEGHQTDLLHDPGLFSSEDHIFCSPFLEGIFKKKDIIEQVLLKKPDVVAFSVYTSTYQWCCHWAAEIKKVFSVPIIFGGIHPTLMPEQSIANSFVDFVIQGEGEDSFLSLLAALKGHAKLAEVKNLCFKKGEEKIINPFEHSLRALDDLPHPDKGKKVLALAQTRRWRSCVS